MIEDLDLLYWEIDSLREGKKSFTPQCPLWKGREKKKFLEKCLFYKKEERKKWRKIIWPLLFGITPSLERDRREDFFFFSSQGHQHLAEKERNQIWMDVARLRIATVDVKKKKKIHQKIVHIIYAILYRSQSLSNMVQSCLGPEHYMPSLKYTQGFHDIVAFFFFFFDENEVRTFLFCEQFAHGYCQNLMQIEFDAGLLPSLGLIKKLLALKNKRLHQIFQIHQLDNFIPLSSWMLTFLTHNIIHQNHLLPFFDAFLTCDPYFIIYVSVSILINFQSEFYQNQQNFEQIIFLIQNFAVHKNFNPIKIVDQAILLRRQFPIEMLLEYGEERGRRGEERRGQETGREHKGNGRQEGYTSVLARLGERRLFSPVLELPLSAKRFGQMANNRDILMNIVKNYQKMYTSKKIIHQKYKLYQIFSRQKSQKIFLLLFTLLFFSLILHFYPNFFLRFFLSVFYPLGSSPTQKFYETSTWSRPDLGAKDVVTVVRPAMIEDTSNS